MMQPNDIETATREQLADELGAAGEYTQDWETAELDDLRDRVRNLVAGRTADTARAAMLDTIHEHGREAACDHVCLALGVAEAEIDAEGDVAVSGSKGGALRHLTGEQLVALVAQLERGV